MLDTIFGFITDAYKVGGILSFLAICTILSGCAIKRIKCNKYFKYKRDVEWYALHVELDYDWNFSHTRVIGGNTFLELQMSRDAFISCYYRSFTHRFELRDEYMWSMENIARGLFKENKECATVAHIPYTGELYAYDRRSNSLFYTPGSGGSGGISLSQREAYQYAIYGSSKICPLSNTLAYSMSHGNSDILCPEMYKSTDTRKEEEKPKWETYKEYQCCIPVMVCSKEYFDSYEMGDDTEFIMYIVDEPFNRCLSFYVDNDGNRFVEELPTCIFDKIILDSAEKMSLNNYRKEEFMKIVKAKRASTYSVMGIFSCRKSKF